MSPPDARKGKEGKVKTIKQNVECASVDRRIKQRKMQREERTFFNEKERTRERERERNKKNHILRPTLFFACFFF